jgi:hypothetical protein
MNNSERNWSKSWHYKLALLGGLNERDFDHDGEINICDYSRKVFWGIIRFIALFIVALFLVRMFFDFVGWIVAMITLGNVIEPYSIYAKFGFVIVLIVFATYILYKIDSVFSKIFDLFSRKEKINSPSFTSSLRESIKNKYCFYIKIK